MTAEEYWQHRNIEREAAARKLSEQTIEKELSRLYRRSLRAIQKEIDALYGRFSAQNGVSISEARKLIASDEFQDWRMDISDYVSEIERTGDSKLLLELNTLAMRSRINRLDELHSVVLREVDKLARKQSTTMDIFLGSQYKEGFLQSAFDIRKYVPNVPVHLSNDDVKAALRTQWSGKNYSERIWGNADKLASVLKQEVVNGLHRGTDVRTMARNVAKRMNVAYKNAIRLVRTEHNYIQNKAHIDSIKDAGMKYFKFVATLDKKTSAQCRDHDGKIYPIDEVVQGLNAPPLHPHCRSVIVSSRKSYNYRKGKRIAKDANGGTIYVPNDMVYEDWKAVYIDKTKTLDEWKAERTITAKQPKNTGPKIKPTKSDAPNPYLADRQYLNSHQYRKQFDMLGLPKDATKALYKEAMLCLALTNGKNQERTALIDITQGTVVGTAMGNENANEVGIRVPVEYLTRKDSLIIVHNHPNNTGFSRADIRAYLARPFVNTAVVVTGVGDIYVISNINRNGDVDMLFEKLYNERNKDGLIEHQVEGVLDQLAKKGAIRYVKKEKTVKY
ncbi:minor capsid protein [Veillonella magna]|uniref:minor capsid protein n=1 Tax=Veillonella magna TaxID=464322 RepID=UPI0026DDBF25|nr:minor capsid protein [Veillonella magna]